MAKSVILKYKEDVYTIDSDTTEGSGEKNILLWMVNIFPFMQTLFKPANGYHFISPGDTA
jgi:hypothetical protein